MRAQPAFARTRSQLVDDVLHGYLNWRQESAAVSTADSRWCGASRGKRLHAFEQYWAALDREELAAADYRRLVDQAH